LDPAVPHLRLINALAIDDRSSWAERMRLGIWRSPILTSTGTWWASWLSKREACRLELLSTFHSI